VDGGGGEGAAEGGGRDGDADGGGGEGDTEGDGDGPGDGEAAPEYVAVTVADPSAPFQPPTTTQCTPSVGVKLSFDA